MEHIYDTIEGIFNYEKIYTDVVKLFGDGAHFVEVGSWKGKSASFMAVEIINSGKFIKFDCIDSFIFMPNGSTDDSVFPKNLYRTFKENTKSVRHIINPIKTTSVIAANSYKNESLDFVFLDAGYDYDNILNDINTWYPKIKKSGIISGSNKNIDALNNSIIPNYIMPSFVNIPMNKTDYWLHRKI